MKKIVFILRMFQQKSFHGGGEKLFYELISRLIKDGHILDIYCSKSDVDKFEGINEIIVVDEPYDHNDPVSMERFYGKVKELTSQKNYDHIISENITPPVGITFLQGHSLAHRFVKLKSPLEQFFYNFRSIKKARIEYQKKWMDQGYEKIFVPSVKLKSDIVDNFGIDGSIIEVIYPGVHQKQQDLKVASFPLTFGLCAVGFKIKGGYIFIEALRHLKKSGFDFKARVIYPKAKRNLWLNLLIKLYGLEKNVEFLSFQQNMENFYSSCDCIVMPSIEDTFGLVALEAMSYGKPCIVSSNAGASEIIEQGVNGFVFEMDGRKAANLAEKMEFLLKNPEKLVDMGQKAFEASGYYNWDRTYLEFIEKLTK